MNILDPRFAFLAIVLGVILLMIGYNTNKSVLKTIGGIIIGLGLFRLFVKFFFENPTEKQTKKSNPVSRKSKEKSQSLEYITHSDIQRIRNSLRERSNRTVTSVRREHKPITNQEQFLESFYKKQYGAPSFYIKKLKKSIPELNWTPEDHPLLLTNKRGIAGMSDNPKRPTFHYLLFSKQNQPIREDDSGNILREIYKSAQIEPLYDPEDGQFTDFLFKKRFKKRSSKN